MSITERSTRGIGWSAGWASARSNDSLDRVERVRPRVSLVLHVPLEDRDRRSASSVGQLDRAGGRRGVPEDGAIGEEAAHLELRVDALLEAPEQLQDEPVAEGHRRVALIAPAELRLERSLAAESARTLRRGCRRAGVRWPRATRLRSIISRSATASAASRSPSTSSHAPSGVSTLATTYSGPMSSPLPLAGEWERVRGGFALGEGHVDEGDHAAEAVPFGMPGRGSCPRSSRSRSSCPSRRTIAAGRGTEAGIARASLRAGPSSTASHEPADLSVGTGDVAISSSRSSAWRRNQKYPYGPSVMKYGNCPIRGNWVGPNSSTGTWPSKRDRSSSTNCALRERLATTSVRSSPNVRRKRHHLAVLGIEELDVAARE